MNASNQLQKLEKECSKHWIQQIKEASEKENMNDVEYATFSLLRFFRRLDDSELRQLQIDDFYQQIIQFIKETEEKNDMISFHFIHFFRSITHLILSDFYRGFSEINKIKIEQTEIEEDERKSFKIEKSDIIYIKFSCLTFFKRYKEAITLLDQMDSDEIIFNDELMKFDCQIRRSLILLKFKKNEEAFKILADIRNNDLIGHYPFLTQSDIDFQIASSSFFEKNEILNENGFDTLIRLSTVKSDISFFQIAYLYAIHNEYDKSVEFINQISLSDRTFSVNLFFGFIYYKMNQFSESYEILKELLKYTQFSAPLFELIGLIFLKTGDIKNAAEFLRNACALDKSSNTNVANYGLSLEAQKETEEFADELYGQMMKISPDWEIFANLSCIFNLEKAEETKHITSRVVEPSLFDVVVSPSEEQIDRLFSCAPFFPAYLLSQINVKCHDVPISPEQGRISLFPVE